MPATININKRITDKFASTSCKRVEGLVIPKINASIAKRPPDGSG